MWLPSLHPSTGRSWPPRRQVVLSGGEGKPAAAPPPAPGTVTAMVARIDSRNRRGPYERGRLLRRAATRFGEGAARSVVLSGGEGKPAAAPPPAPSTVTAMVARIDSRNWRGPYERGRLLRRAATRFGEGAARDPIWRGSSPVGAIGVVRFGAVVPLAACRRVIRLWKSVLCTADLFLIRF
uniref:Uncharacterized protein n=1 Tax=Oryza rufipogon TaxID=4529 RepID=A0A0E0RGZ1_ORYRU